MRVEAKVKCPCGRELEVKIPVMVSVAKDLPYSPEGIAATVVKKKLENICEVCGKQPATGSENDSNGRLRRTCIDCYEILGREWESRKGGQDYAAGGAGDTE